VYPRKDLRVSDYGAVEQAEAQRTNAGQGGGGMISPAQMRQIAAGFLFSRHPMVVLAVPGCGPVLINRKHVEDPLLRFDHADDLLVQDEAEFVERMMLFLRQQKRGRGGKATAAVRCYCGKIQSFLALRDADCPHEESHRLFLDYAGALVWTPSWEFICKPGGENSVTRRRYAVLRTHSRLMGGTTPPSATVKGLLNTRLVPSHALDLVVEGPRDGKITARVDVIDDAGRRHGLVEAFSAEVVKKRLKPYRIMENALLKAHDDPANARGYLDAAERTLSGSESNYPVQELIQTIFQADGDQPTESIIKQRLHIAAARLWDAPVVGDELRRRLDRAMRMAPSEPRWTKLPVAVQSEIADLSMTLPELEESDLYLRPRAIA
jgi:hypothetical protein